MNVYELDPISDERWGSFLEIHPDASIFHTREWLEALRRTYRYTPTAFTTSSPTEPLINGIVFCEVSSWLSGCRLVSLPFSDHCSPLMQSCEQLNDIFDYLRAQRAGKKWAYIEVRYPSSAPAQHFRNFAGQQVFAIHKLALDGREQVWQRLHQNCVRRKVQRAAREQVSCVEGRSDSLLRQFYELLVMTRARHGVPPQPISWFQNLIECLGSKIKISVAFKGDRPIAGILILQYKQVVTYKYGCSDPRFSSLGGIQHLLWKTIQDGIADGMVEFDMGRSDPGQGGLIAFKRRWGAAESQLMYLRFPARPPHSRSSARIARIGKYVCSHVPSRILTVAGNALYRHAG